MEEFRQTKSNMLEEFRQSKSNMEKKFSESLSELKQKMSLAQERTSQQLTKRIGSSTYQFRRKGNEHQFNFNCGVEDAIASAKTELSKVKPTDSSTSEAVKKAELYLDEGSKALATRQKHIKIVSWATVNHYMADPLADGPEDEKEIIRSENEARQDLE